MVISTIVLALLAAEPSPAPKLAMPDFNAVNIPPAMSRLCSEHLARELGTRGLSVVTARDIEALLGLERQKQLLGCGPESVSCMAELANALGADAVLLGDFGKLGSRYQVNLKVVAANNASVLADFGASIASDDELLPELTRAATQLAPVVLQKLGRAPAAAQVVEAPAAPKVETETPARRWPLWPTVVAGVAAGVAVGGGLIAMSAHNSLTDPRASAVRNPGDAQGIANRGSTAQTVGFVAAGVSAAALGTAVALYLLSPSSDLSAGAFVTPSSASVSVSVVLP